MTAAQLIALVFTSQVLIVVTAGALALGRRN